MPPIIIYNHRTIILKEWMNMIQLMRMKVKAVISMCTYQRMKGQILTTTAMLIIWTITNNIAMTLRIIGTNEPEVDNSDDDIEHNPNDIYQPEDPVSLSRRSHKMSTWSRLGNVITSLPNVRNDTGLDGPHWEASHTCPMLLMTVVAAQAGIRMIKEYFKIEASKSTPPYWFRKRTETIW